MCGGGHSCILAKSLKGRACVPPPKARNIRFWKGYSLVQLLVVEHRMIEMRFGLLLIMLAFASENQENKVESAKSEEEIAENAEDLILVKIEEDDYTKENVTKMFDFIDS